jgi:hypothetical protein
MCEGHNGLEKVVPSHSADSVDISCNSGAQFTAVPMIKEASDCQIINGKRYCN